MKLHKIKIQDLKRFFDTEEGILISLSGLLLFLSKTYYLIISELEQGDIFIFSLAQGIFLATVTTLVIRQSSDKRQKIIFSSAEFLLVSVYYAKDSLAQYSTPTLSILIGAFTCYSVYTLGTLSKDSSKSVSGYTYCPNCAKKLPSSSRTDRKFCSKKCTDNVRRLASS